MELAAAIVSTLLAKRNCQEKGCADWEAKHTEKLEALVREYMPSGSGFDSGTQLIEGSSDAKKLVFTTSFHHMDEMGGYVGWTDHKVTVRPAFQGLDITVSGWDKNNIKEYIWEMFYNALRAEYFEK